MFQHRITHFLLLLCLFWGQSLVAQSAIQLVSATQNELVLQVTPSQYVLNPVRNQEVSVSFLGEKTTPFLQKGAPDLGKYDVSFVIPDDAKMEIAIEEANFTDIPNISLISSKGNLTRNINPANVDYEYSSVYERDAFFPEKIASLQQPYILRDFRGQTVWISPVQYNPISHVLRIYKNIKIRIYQNGKGGENVFYRASAPTKVDKEFDQIYRKQFINLDQTASYTTLEEEGDMLILAHGAFMPDMQPFIAWKKQKGIQVEMVDIATIGTNTTLIKNYIENYYNTHHFLKYVVFVGDHPQIPTMTYNGNPSDNAYSYILGGDSYPELFMGRFSGENSSEIQTQVTRTIAYEKTPNTAATWYNKGLTIASSQGPGDDNQYDFEHEHEIRAQLLAYTYTDVAELYDGTHTTDSTYIDAAGDPIQSDVTTLVNAGVGCINYTGHGGPTQWVTTSYANADVQMLENSGMFPFIWTVGCVSGEFMNATCFAESWLRATHPLNGSPTGAVAAFMSTINQSWDPPMEGQDEMNKILTENASTNIKRTFGGLSFNGCMQMNDAYGAQGAEMTDTWTLFGDPSVMVFTTTPMAMTVTHAPSLVLGSYAFTVNGSVNDALVSLTQNGEIVGTGTITSGSVLINFPNPIISTNPIIITATAFNHAPYIGTITVTIPTGPYIIANPFLINDATGNNNQEADFNENIILGQVLQNVGSQMANATGATLSTSDSYITILDGNQTFGNINASASVSQNAAFQIEIGNNVPDQHITHFDVTIQDNASNTWVSPLNMVINAPVLSAISIQINDATGNNNGFLDAGETATLTIVNKNSGHADALAAIASLTTSNPNVTIQNASANVGAITKGNGQANAVFTVSISASATQGESAAFQYQLTEAGYLVNQVFNTTISPAIINFESNNTVPITWTLGGTVPWFTSVTLPYEGSNCQESGDIGNGQLSEMSFSWGVTADDSISFYRKTSCEASWDFLHFLVDGIEVEKWSGEMAWERVAYPLAAGQHELKWIYDKDQYVSAGSDAAYIDYITLPSGTGVSAISQAVLLDRGIAIFPNPTNDIFSVEFEAKNSENISLRLYDAQGKRLISTVPIVFNGKILHSFDMSQYAKGIYFLQIAVDREVATKKIILK